MWCWVTGHAVQRKGLLEGKGTKILQTWVITYPVTRASHLRRTEYSWFLLLLNTYALIYKSVVWDDFSVPWYTPNQIQHTQLLYITICSQVCKIIYNMIKVKLSLYKPRQAPRVPGGVDTTLPDDQHTEVVRLSVLCIGCFYPSPMK